MYVWTQCRKDKNKDKKMIKKKSKKETHTHRDTYSHTYVHMYVCMFIVLKELFSFASCSEKRVLHNAIHDEHGSSDREGGRGS